MSQEVTVLVISPNKDLFDSVSKAAMICGDSVRVLKRTAVKEAIELFDRLDLVSGNIQIYLDSKSCKAEAQSFVHLLDHDYAGITRRSVVLIDDASNITSMMSLAIAECVGDVLNYPVLSIEVETAIRKRFPKLRDSSHSKSIV
jgi:hypothetical protein